MDPQNQQHPAQPAQPLAELPAEQVGADRIVVESNASQDPAPGVDPSCCIVFEDVSRFYGEVLGVNRVSLTLEPGIISLVGPNGSGKSTLMNLMTGLLRPTQGTVTVLSTDPTEPQDMFRRVGFCSQYDSFPDLTGHGFLYAYLRVHGYDHAVADGLAWRSIERVNLAEAAHRKVAGFSKGMRQRIKLAQAMCHEPNVLVLDEPLNGLDPMARAEIIALFKELRDEGRHLIISSHILHEVDMISDRVVLLNSGYVVAEGNIHGVRDEMKEHPMQVLLRCDQAPTLAARLFALPATVSVELHEDRRGLLVQTRDADRFFLDFNQLVTDMELHVETVAPADDDVQAVYRYLISGDELIQPEPEV